MLNDNKEIITIDNDGDDDAIDTLCNGTTKIYCFDYISL